LKYVFPMRMGTPPGSSESIIMERCGRCIEKLFLFIVDFAGRWEYKEGGSDIKMISSKYQEVN
ncbi:MAG: hypothetical protein J5897_07870, partial [Candidatus Methanomethylophilus sp.]|nr:hypothetical protein [Methanomethylophilus sp.]